MFMRSEGKSYLDIIMRETVACSVTSGCIALLGFYYVKAGGSHGHNSVSNGARDRRDSPTLTTRDSKRLTSPLLTSTNNHNIITTAL